MTRRSVRPEDTTLRRKAIGYLLLATAFWGLSFPVTKAFGLLQEQSLPNSSSWFRSASIISVRFCLAAAVMLVWSLPKLASITRLEIYQGLGLGLFGGAGLLFQMDGLIYTSASNSAFLTQSYCVALPVIAALRDRKWPPVYVLMGSLLVVAGVAVLARVDWRNLRLGRGECETLVSALFFAAQLLWLERPRFYANRIAHVSLVMFATITALACPVACVSAAHATDWLMAFNSRAAVFLMILLVSFCTLGAFVIMNRWQPKISAPEAGLIYTAEPLFASLLALFLPAWLSALAALNYSNEAATMNLMVGGGLITAANALVTLASPNQADAEDSPRLASVAPEVRRSLPPE